MQNQNKWSFGENSRLRCFVANFIANGFTRFLCYFLGAKSALVLIFTVLECLDEVGFNCFLLHCDWAQVITLHVCDCARRQQISCISSGIVEALFSVIYGTRHQSSLNLLHENRSRGAIPTEVLLLEWFPQIVSSSPTTSHSKIGCGVFHQSKTNLQVSIQASHRYIYMYMYNPSTIHRHICFTSRLWRITYVLIFIFTFKQKLSCRLSFANLEIHKGISQWFPCCPSLTISISTSNLFCQNLFVL